jgi:hypothetical protein
LAANRCPRWPSYGRAAQRLAYAGLTGGVLALASAVAAGAPATIEAAGAAYVGALFAGAVAGPAPPPAPHGGQPSLASADAP